jgi:uncharacterized heparinase superfamily protein
MTLPSIALPHVIAHWQKNARESVEVSLDQFKGRPIISAWVLYQNESGEYRRSKKGLCMAARHLPMLAEALADAEAEARKCGLLP